MVAALGGFIGDGAKDLLAVALIHPQLRIAVSFWREPDEIGSSDEMLLDVALRAFLVSCDCQPQV